MYYLLTALWLIVIGVGWWDEKQVIPIVIASLGIIVQIGFWFFSFGFFGIAALGVLVLIGMFSSHEIFLNIEVK
ncbi:MAG: hypothetical protein GXX91_17595 [Verrucomicrobiaceae bacterium]|nr:hypothetical protein [Verrucomicrobiaceae bacterium]